MQQRLWLGSGVLREMLEACQTAYPSEACGLLGGKSGVASTHYGVANVADRPTERFEMDPAGQLKAFRLMEERGEELIAIYHSHPSTAAVPSKADLRQFAYPDAFYIIVGLSGGGVQVRAYRVDIIGRRAVEVYWFEARSRRV